MTTKTQTCVRVVQQFEASAERIFDAWLDLKTAGRWLFATAGGEMVRVVIDARVGGRFEFVDRRSGEEVQHTGEYLELERPRRLVFTFAVPKYSSVATRVAIDIVALGSQCQLTLLHEGILPEYEAQTQQGWTMLLDGLAASLGSAPRA